MSTRLFLTVIVSLLLITAAALIRTTIVFPSIFPSIATPEEWQIRPDNSTNSGDYHLMPANGSCVLNMPNGTSVTVPKECNVLLADCAVTVGQALRPECDTLRLDSTELALGQSAANDTPNFTGTPFLLKPVDCPSSQNVVHNIQSGDTLWGLSVKYKLSLNDLLTFNHMSATQAEHLALGYPICIPTSP